MSLTSGAFQRITGPITLFNPEPSDLSANCQEKRLLLEGSSVERDRNCVVAIGNVGHSDIELIQTDESGREPFISEGGGGGAETDRHGSGYAVQGAYDDAG